jgi:hypothetical protein
VLKIWRTSLHLRRTKWGIAFTSFGVPQMGGVPKKKQANPRRGKAKKIKNRSSKLESGFLIFCLCCRRQLG